MSKVLVIQICNAAGGKSLLSIGDRIDDQFVTDLDVHRVNSKRTETRIVTVPSSIYYAPSTEQFDEEEWYEESWEDQEESSPLAEEQLKSILEKSNYDTRLRHRIKELAEEWTRTHPEKEEEFHPVIVDNDGTVTPIVIYPKLSIDRIPKTTLDRDLGGKG